MRAAGRARHARAVAPESSCVPAGTPKSAASGGVTRTLAPSGWRTADQSTRDGDVPTTSARPGSGRRSATTHADADRSAGAAAGPPPVERGEVQPHGPQRRPRADRRVWSRGPHARSGRRPQGRRRRVRRRELGPSDATRGELSRRCRAGRGPAPGGGRCPGRRGRAVDVQLGDHVVADLGGDALEQRAGEQPQLGGPRGRLGLDGQLAVVQLDRAAVRGDVRRRPPSPRRRRRSPRPPASASRAPSPAGPAPRRTSCGSRGSGPGPE